MFHVKQTKNNVPHGTIVQEKEMHEIIKFDAAVIGA